MPDLIGDIAETIEGNIDRQYMAHLLDAGLLCHGTDTAWERLGDDLEEYNVDLSPSTETKSNILGQNTFHHNGYEASSEASPYYANTKSKLFPKLQKIVDHRYKDDNCRTKALELHLWDGNETDGFAALLQDCYVIPTSYGGNTAGYQIPFTVHYVGKRTEGIFKNGVFTPKGAVPTE